MPPDQIRIEMTLGQKAPDFADAIEKCNQRVAQIRAAAAAAAPENELKTASFGVEVDSEWDERVRRHVEVGFVAKQSEFVILPWAKARVAEFLTSVIASGAQPAISLQFMVSDAEGLKQAVLADAVKNARQRAEIIAASAGINLGPIQNIQSGYVEIRVTSEPSEAVVACSKSFGSDIDPDDITSHDGVTVTWLIED